MRKFKITTLSVSGKRNSIYTSGEVISESGFHDADALVASGHIVEVTEAKEAKKETVEVAEEAVSETVEAVTETVEVAEEAVAETVAEAVVTPKKTAKK